MIVAESFEVLTCWGALAAPEDRDVHKDARAAWYARLLVEQLCPWLPKMLNAAAASVIAGPGAFFVSLPDGEFLMVPELSAHMALLPWAEPGETIH